MKREDLKGILYTLVFAIAAYVLGGYFPIVGGPVFGILIGMMFARRRRARRFCSMPSSCLALR